MRLSVSDQPQPKPYPLPFSHNTSVTNGQTDGRQSCHRRSLQNSCSASKTATVKNDVSKNGNQI